MAQAFATTYSTNFKWPEYSKRAMFSPRAGFFDILPESDLWLIQKHLEDEYGREGLAVAEEIVRRMYRKRLWSTYQVEYGKALKEHGELTELPENELLEYCRKLYAFDRPKLLPPLSSSRKLYGYMRPSRLYTPLTSYQFDIGKVAYDVLKENSKSKHDKQGEKDKESGEKKVKELEKKNLTLEDIKKKSVNLSLPSKMSDLEEILTMPNGIKIYKNKKCPAKTVVCKCK